MDIEFSAGTIAGFAFAGIFVTIMPLLLFIFWRKKNRAAYMPFLYGIFLYGGVSLLRGLIRSGFSKADPSFYYFQAALLTALMEEGVRYAAFRLFIQGYESREDAVSYGIGHSFFEVVAAGYMYFGYLYTGLSFKSRGAEAFMAEVEPENAARMLEYLKYVSEISPLHSLCQFLASASAIAFHISMSVLIFYGIRKEKGLICLSAAAALHFLLNFITALMPLGLKTAIQAISSALLGYGAYRLYCSLPRNYE